MTIPSLNALVHTSDRRPWRLPTRRRRERAAVVARNLTLASAGTGVPSALVENDPMLLHLVVADLCWRLAAEDLGKRRPGRGNRGARAAWLAEKECLEAERKRLAEMVTASISAL
jgi:hypothetical protein